MGMYKSVHVVIGTPIEAEDFEEKLGCHPYEVDEKYDGIAAYSGGELQHDHVVVGKPVYDFSEQYHDFDSDNDVVLDLDEALRTHRQSVSERLAELEIHGKTSIYLVGQML
jgi:hypothetical protein